MWNGAYLLGSFIGPTAYGFVVDSIGFRAATMTFLPILALALFGNISELLAELVKSRRKKKKKLVPYRGRFPISEKTSLF